MGLAYAAQALESSSSESEEAESSWPPEPSSAVASSESSAVASSESSAVASSESSAVASSESQAVASSSAESVSSSSESLSSSSSSSSGPSGCPEIDFCATCPAMLWVEVVTGVCGSQTCSGLYNFAHVDDTCLWEYRTGACDNSALACGLFAGEPADRWFVQVGSLAHYYCLWTKAAQVYSCPMGNYSLFEGGCAACEDTVTVYE